MGDLSKNFSRHEFACRCGCGLAHPTPALVRGLQKVRDLAGIPLEVISGSRCEAHNKAEGGKLTSAHLTGDAADLRAESGTARFLIVRAAVQAGFTRIGIGRTFVHLDVVTDFNHPQEVLWLY
jgi:zinc D-Ala-D-Ala carboxypeptidase